MKQNLLSIQIESKSASESGLDCKISTAFCTSHDACVLLLPKFSNHLFDKGLLFSYLCLQIYLKIIISYHFFILNLLQITMSQLQLEFFLFFFNWYSLHARLNSHYEAWSHKEKKHKKVKAYSKSN